MVSGICVLSAPWAAGFLKSSDPYIGFLICYCTLPATRRYHVSSTLSARSATSAATTNVGHSRGQSHASAVGFSTWAEQVRLNTEIRGDNFPVPLSQLLSDSKLVPAWIYDEASPKYDSCKPFHSKHICLLSKLHSKEPLTPSNDADLSRDTQLLLPLLLRVVTHQEVLIPLGASPTEADRRHAMDAFSFDLWDLLTSDDFHYSLERSLRLPQTTPMELYETKPDAVVFFRVSPVRFEDRISLACSSLAGKPLDNSSVLHWTTEFKRDQEDYNEHGAKRQMFRALVSGLYQRRALGFPEHFVFGTAHHSTTTLDVFAATWEVPAGGQEPKTSTGKPEIPGSNVPKAGQRGTEGAVKATLDTHIDRKGEGDQSKTRGNEPGASDERGQIVVYQLGTFNMLLSFDMLRLCLLMRRTRLLGCQYREAIENNYLDRILQQEGNSAWIYDWPAPPRPPSTSNTRGSNQSGRLEPTLEEREHKRVFRTNDLGTNDQAGKVGFSAPLKRRYVEEWDDCLPKSKVLRYLADSPWEQCEPVPDQIIDADD